MPTDLPPASVSESDLDRLISWNARHLPAEQPKIQIFKQLLESTFGDAAGSDIIHNAATLRSRTNQLISDMSTSRSIIVADEVTAANVNDGAGEWNGSPLQVSCKEQLRHDSQKADTRRIAMADLAIFAPEPKIAGMVVKFRLLERPECLDAVKFSKVYKEAVLQCAFTLAAFFQQCGTRLGMTVVNGSFTRLLMSSKDTLCIEVVDDLGGVCEEITTFEDLAIWDEFWEEVMAHNILGGKDELELYWETMAQGFRHTAALMTGQLPRSLSIAEHDTDDEWDATGGLRAQLQSRATQPSSGGDSIKRSRGSAPPSPPPSKRQRSGTDQVPSDGGEDGEDGGKTREGSAFTDDTEEHPIYFKGADGEELDIAAILPTLVSVLNRTLRIRLIGACEMDDLIGQILPTPA